MEFRRITSPKPQELEPTKDYVRIYQLFMQNKPNFIRFSPQNEDLTKKQTQFKANLTQNKPNLSQYKANSNPILRMNAFAWIKNFTIILIVLLADLTTLKGAKTKQISRLFGCQFRTILTTLTVICRIAILDSSVFVLKMLK